MSSSRENSPDWLRSFQAPTVYTALSSDSEPSGDKSLARDDGEEERDESKSNITVKYDTKNSSDKKSANKRAKVSGGVSAKRRKTDKQKKGESEDEDDVTKEDSSEKQVKTHGKNRLVLALSSDSESDSKTVIRKIEANGDSSTDESLKLVTVEEDNDNEKSSPKVAKKGKSPNKRIKSETLMPSKKKRTDDLKVEEVDDINVPEEDIREKHVEPRVGSSTLPLMLSEKVYRSKALVECEGDSIDLSGDMGAVGRVIIPETPSKEPEMFLDLKGTIYKTTIVPSRTFCVVSIGQSEAKVEAIMNDFIQLTPQSNVYDAETMVEGTLEGFSFDSDDEADKKAKDKGDQNEGDEEKPNEKRGGKAEKKKGATQKKAKGAGGKPMKKKKPQAARKDKSKK